MGMSIAIKDFEMPQSCYNCNFCLRRRTSDYGYFGMCDLTNEEGLNLYEHNRSENCPLVEAIPKANYEARLKDDMVAMLRFLWNDIENLDAPICDYASSDCISKWQVHEVIQQKIDALKENKDEKED